MKYKCYVSDSIGGQELKIKAISEEKDTPQMGGFLADYGYVYERLTTTLGDTLTIIDACLDDPTKKKSVKDLIRKATYDRIEKIGDDMILGDCIPLTETASLEMSKDK